MKRPANLKVGDRFVLNDNYWQGKKGTVWELVRDDQSLSPWFNQVDDHKAKVGTEICICFSMLDPYNAKQKFGGYFDGNKTVVYVGKAKGEANYNPEDAKNGMPYNAAIGLLLAYCRATGTDTEIVDKLFKKVEDKPAKPDTFEVGDYVKIKSALPDGSHGIGTLFVDRARNQGVHRITSSSVNSNYISLDWKDHVNFLWHKSMLEKVPQPVKEKPLEVIIDGVNYVKESAK